MKHTRTTTKKILSVLLALLMVILSVPFAFAEGADEPEVLLSGEYGTITWSLTDDGTLTVGGTGAIEPASVDGEGEDAILHYPWYDAVVSEFGAESVNDVPFSALCELFKSLVVEEGITAIGKEAFAGTPFESVTLASTVESLGEYSFFNPFVEKITILNPNLSFEENDVAVFGFLGEESVFSDSDELLNWFVGLFFNENGGDQLMSEIGENYFEVAGTIAYAMYYANAQAFELSKASYVSMAAQNYGISATNFDDLIAKILNRFNTVLGTNFTDLSQLFIPWKSENEDTLAFSGALGIALGVSSPENMKLFATEMLSVNLGQSLYGIHYVTVDPETGEPWNDPSGPVTVYPWLTVYGYEGSTAQAAAEASGVNFVSLGEAPSDPTDPHVHSYLFSGEITRTPTCIDPGEGIYTCECGESETREIGIDPTNHVNTENKAAVASTCTVKGFTAGVYCNDCETWVSGHEEAALDTTNHVNTENKAAVASNCTETGFTAGVYCNDCKTWVSGHEVVGVDASKHAELNENGDCTRCGKHVKDIEKPTEPTTDSDNEPDSRRPGLITRIIDWFRNLFAKILSFFGLKK